MSEPIMDRNGKIHIPTSVIMLLVAAVAGALWILLSNVSKQEWRLSQVEKRLEQQEQVINRIPVLEEAVRRLDDNSGKE